MSRPAPVFSDADGNEVGAYSAIIAGNHEAGLCGPRSLALSPILGG